MADRTLRRPMFRRGGFANEGIMSGLQDQSGYVDESRLGLNSLVRPGYAEGDVVEPANTQEYRDYLEEQMYPSNIIGGTSRLFSNITDALYNYGARPLGNLAQYFVPIPGIDPIEKKDSVKENIEKVMEMKGIDIDDEVKESEIINLKEIIPEGADPGDGTTLGKNESGDMTESDLKTVYADLLPMFRETLGVDDKEFTRDKYLELAKFGTNLLAQPGGSLTQAIGKAATPSLEGLGRIASEKRKAAQRPAELALSAALKEMTPGSIGKGVRDLMKLGKTKAEAIKIVTEQGGSGIATKRLKFDMIKDLKVDMQKDFQIEKGLDGAAKKMYESEELGVMSTDYKVLPEDKKDRKHGSYYVDPESGKIGRYNKPTGDLIEPGDTGFTGKATKSETA